jgi:hypothetical protein
VTKGNYNLAKLARTKASNFKPNRRPSSKFPITKVIHQYLYVFVYSLVNIGVVLFGRTLGQANAWQAPNGINGRELAAYWGNPYAGHDASSYYLAAWSWYEDGVLADWQWHWVTNLWPPGMVMHYYGLLSAFGPDFPILVVVALIALLIWATVFSLYFGPLISNWRGVLFGLVAIPAVLWLFPFSSWILGTYVAYPSGFAIAFFLIAAKLLFFSLKSASGAYLVALAGGFFLGVAALYRVTNYVLINALAATISLFMIWRLFSGLSRREGAARLVSSVGMLWILFAVLMAARSGFWPSQVGALQLALSSLLIAGATTLVFGFVRNFLASKVQPQFLSIIGVSILLALIVVQTSVASALGFGNLIPTQRFSLALFLFCVFLIAQFSLSQSEGSFLSKLISATGLNIEKAPRREKLELTGTKLANSKPVAPSASFALLLFVLPGLILTQGWTTVVSEQVRPEPRSYVVTVPALAYASAWQTDEQITQRGTWLTTTNVNWACRLDPVQCAEIERLETSSDSPYSGSGALSGEELRNRAIVAALRNPVGYVNVRAGDFWLQWSSGKPFQGGLLALIAISALLWSLRMTLRRDSRFRSLHFLWLLYLLLSTLPMAYILFFPYYFFPIQIGSIFYGLTAISCAKSEIPRRSSSSEKFWA